jgi:very-short-patch-repair endonuclease
VMARLTLQRSLVERQFGVVDHDQLAERGYSNEAIDHRVETGRLHRVFRGVYAVGRPELTQKGWWMAAVRACRPEAWLSHGDGAALYGVRERPPGDIHLTIPLDARRSHEGIAAHRRHLADHEKTVHAGIPVAAIEVVLADLAAELRRGPLEAAINEADVRGLITVPRLRERAESMPRRAGRKPLRETIDRRTFRYTRSGLERALIPLALSAGLSRPQTRVVVCGWEVDFFWPDLGLVVETDSLTYHRTPQAQAKDRLRDQAHIAAGLTPLRFTHSQIRYEPGYVRAMLATVARRLRGRAEQVGHELQQLRHG